MSNVAVRSNKGRSKILLSLIVAWTIFTVFFISMQYISLYISDADISSTFKILLFSALSLLILTLVVVLIFILRKINGEEDFATFFFSQGVIMVIITVVSLVFSICYFMNLANFFPTWLSISGAIVLLILFPGIVIYFVICFLIGFSRGDSSLVILTVSVILNGVIWYFYGYSIYYLITKLRLKERHLQCPSPIGSQSRTQK